MCFWTPKFARLLNTQVELPSRQEDTHLKAKSTFMSSTVKPGDWVGSLRTWKTWTGRGPGQSWGLPDAWKQDLGEEFCHRLIRIAWGGCIPWGLEESDTTERLHFHFSLSCIGEGNGSPLQCSCLENPRDGGAWWAAVYGVAQSQI